MCKLHFIPKSNIYCARAKEKVITVRCQQTLRVEILRSYKIFDPPKFQSQKYYVRFCVSFHVTTIHVIYDDARMWIQINYIIINEDCFAFAKDRLGGWLT